MSRARTPDRPYRLGEEIFSSVSHGIGALLGVAATALLVVRAAKHAPEGHTGKAVTAMAVFGATFLVLYLMSTLYHALVPKRAKHVFALLDHSSIYLLIAGTYTPFCLICLPPATGWTIFGLNWAFAVAGIALYCVFEKRLRVLNVAMYIGMGWLILFAIKPLHAVLPPASFTFLWAGGLAYTVGCLFYAAKKRDWTHAIWHLFVLGGSICHFFAAYFSIPLAAAP
ncbi:MAG: hemolysin III family protein [Kiritimatiellae bacterium]|nr:hemolysin III family protein [Kiritimatiellia bacterium]